MRHDPLKLFGHSFTDEYIQGFYAGLRYLSQRPCLVPTDRGLAVRLKDHPDIALETIGAWTVPQHER